MSPSSPLGRFLPNLAQSQAQVAGAIGGGVSVSAPVASHGGGFHDKRHPREMGVAEVQSYLSYLAVQRNVAAATQRQAPSPVR
ncbi:MAG TPA: phage integrase N-terminal SAM-like domain-containing protein [Verrucomicrobiae bacterium]|nr:phage integrase N-terminal SAM-like domain-containing protein [Verrucomicrobiae bacterium]